MTAGYSGLPLPATSGGYGDHVMGNINTERYPDCVTGFSVCADRVG